MASDPRPAQVPARGSFGGMHPVLRSSVAVASIHQLRPTVPPGLASLRARSCFASPRTSLHLAMQVTRNGHSFSRDSSLVARWNHHAAVRDAGGLSLSDSLPSESDDATGWMTGADDTVGGAEPESVL